tara:strand:- start:24 stop:1163 length:1140 start_codon:yes stop_codon:yes gene_type:complete
MSKIYKKNDSFVNLKLTNNNNDISKAQIIEIIKKSISLFNKPADLKILSQIILDFSDKDNLKEKFNLKVNVKKEIEGLDNKSICRYLIHRYRYEIYPENNIIDDYPPYLQIEPTSICNYRCVFCYQTDNLFNKKTNGFMGHMSLDTFKKIVDQAENNIEFISIASRGEPLICPSICEMLKYTYGKFLNLKLNTNASLLDEKKSHAILQSGVKTLVFSADAAETKLYSELRVNGKLEKILKNIDTFNSIKEKQYKDSQIITRVSGVKVSKSQNIDEMESFWGKLVDQVAFVEYVPWENVYSSKATNIKKPCSDLWRRMFIWWDGKINPCDVDYKSELKVGNFSKLSLSDAWKSDYYQNLRKNHLNNLRYKTSPCDKCAVT